jgi:hypothetical protein
MFLRSQNEVIDMGHRAVQAFKAALDTRTDEQMYRGFLKLGPTCLLTDDGIYKLEDMFKKQWGDIMRFRLVGSARLGFSLNPSHPWRIFDFNESDLDMAIVSPELFAETWASAHAVKFWQKKGDFIKYVAEGWIRPDLLPEHLSKDWFDFFRSFQKDRVFEALKVRAALYPTEYFLERYQKLAILKSRGF